MQLLDEFLQAYLKDAWGLDASRYTFEAEILWPQLPRYIGVTYTLGDKSIYIEATVNEYWSVLDHTPGHFLCGGV